MEVLYEINRFAEQPLVALNIGLPLDQLKFVFCFLLSFPLGIVYRGLPNSIALKQVFVTSIGLYFAWFTLEKQILHSMISSSVVYLLAFIVPRRFYHSVVFTYAMTHMSVGHLYRLYTDYLGWSMDFSAPQMILTIKLTMFGFSYTDGGRNAKELSPQQQAMKIDQLPSLLQYFSYIYFFPGFLSGPAFEYAEVAQFIDGTQFKSLPNGKTGIPYLEVVINFVTAFLCAGIAQLLGMYPLAYCRAPEFLELSLPIRVVYITFVTALNRFNYYFAWKLTEAASVLIGIAYNGIDPKTKQHRWDRARNVNILRVEFAQSFKEVADNWNMRTDRWLKYYIYIRLIGTPFEKHNVALTFLTSAFWHGFYPGYYLSFMTAAIGTNLARVARRKLRPFFMKDETTPLFSKKFYDAGCLILCYFALNLTFAPFVVLSWEFGLLQWQSTYFLIHLIYLVGFVGLRFVRTPKTSSATPAPHKKDH